MTLHKYKQKTRVEAGRLGQLIRRRCRQAQALRARPAAAPTDTAGVRSTTQGETIKTKNRCRPVLRRSPMRRASAMLRRRSHAKRDGRRQREIRAQILTWVLKVYWLLVLVTFFNGIWKGKLRP